MFGSRSDLPAQVVSSDGSRVEVWVVCDQAGGSPLRLTLATFLWTSFTPSHSWTLDTSCAAAGASLVADWALQELLQEGGCSLGSYDQHRLQYCLLTFRLETQDTATVLHTNYIMAPPKVWTVENNSSYVRMNVLDAFDPAHCSHRGGGDGAQ